MPNHEGLLLLLWGYGMLVKILEVGANTQSRSRRLGSGGSVEAYAVDTTEETVQTAFYYLNKEHKPKRQKHIKAKSEETLRKQKCFLEFF